METIEAAKVQVGVAGASSRSPGEDTAVEQELGEDVPVVRVAIDSLVIADSPRLSGENAEHIQALADAQGALPAIIVHRASMRVLDGMHRLRAAQSRGHREIGVRFFDGDDADAFVLAVRSNIAHGLPLSLADRKAAATRIITSHPQWSDRLIASATGLAAKTIAEIRRRRDGQAPSTDTRIGRDGRSRPTNTTERRTIAGKLLTDDPDLSLRHVAKIAGISPETVRHVRNHLHHTNPNPPQPTRPQQPDHPTKPPGLDQAMRQLRSDPTLQCTETGRTLLRLLDTRRISNEQWDELSTSVPTHHKHTIATLAAEIAKTWKRFSDNLTKKDTVQSDDRRPTTIHR